MLLCIYENEKDKDPKDQTSSPLHKGTSSQRSLKVQQKTQTQEKL